MERRGSFTHAELSALHAAYFERWDAGLIRLK